MVALAPFNLHCLHIDTALGLGAMVQMVNGLVGFVMWALGINRLKSIYCIKLLGEKVIMVKFPFLLFT